MLQLVRRVLGFSNILVVLALLSACTMSLVPQYQQSLVDGINAANTKALTLFASVAEGSPKSDYGKYAATYDQLIGSFNALAVSAASRPVPALAAKFLAGQLKTVCATATNAAACVNSTSDKLTAAAEDFVEMKHQHAYGGLTPTVLIPIKTDYDFSILQALTIENALKR
jgi:hypothetical protein